MTQEEDDPDMKDLSQEMVTLMAMRAKHLKRIKELETKKTLTITYKRKHGANVVLAPGIVTPVSFSPLPLVWCPNDLAGEVGGKEEQMHVEVEVSPTLVLLSKSRFLTPELLEALSPLMDYSLFGDEFNVPLELVHTEQEGASSTDFDRKVKGKGNIMVIIKASTHFVFGAFVADKWGSGGGWISGSEKNFVFTLGDVRQDPKPLKLAKQLNTQSVHISSCGFHVGSSGALVAFCSSTTNFPNGDFKPAPGFEDVIVSATTVAGVGGTYSPLAIEVYQVGHAE
jgi:hypothetical protein